MKFFIFRIVFFVAELVHFAQSSALKKPATVKKPASLGPYPQNRYCSVRFDFDKTYYGNCIYPGVSSEQCEDGLSLRGSCGNGYHNEEIFCCVRIKCNAHLDGDCQNRNKNCPGTYALGALRYWSGDLEPIPNKCPFLGYPAECCVRDPLPGLQGPMISSIKTDAICPLVDGRFPPPACIADQGSPCCVDLVDAAQPQIPADGSQQDDVVRDASLIPPPRGANGPAVDQEVYRSEVEGESSTGNQLPVQRDPPSSAWNQISVQSDSFLNENQGPATEGSSSSTGSQQPAQGDSLSTGAQFLDPDPSSPGASA